MLEVDIGHDDPKRVDTRDQERTSVLAVRARRPVRRVYFGGGTGGGNGRFPTTRHTTNNFEYLPEAFEISDGIILPVAAYRFQDVSVAYDFGPQRPVPGTLIFRTGGFFSGDRRELSYDGRVELTSQFSLEPRVSLNWVDLAEGSFTARLVSARVSYAFTPRTFVSSLVQFNSSSDSFSGSVRFRREYEPGSDFFVVYSEGRNDLSSDPFLVNRTLAVKLTKLFRF